MVMIHIFNFLHLLCSVFFLFRKGLLVVAVGCFIGSACISNEAGSWYTLGTLIPLKHCQKWRFRRRQFNQDYEYYWISRLLRFLDRCRKYTSVKVDRRRNKSKLNNSEASYSGAWFLLHHVESHTNSRGTAGANKRCQGARMQRTRAVCRSQCMGFSASLLSQARTRTNL